MANSVLYRFQKLADESQQAMTRRRKPEMIRIQIGSATCEHAAGSREVYEEFQKHLTASGRDDISLHWTGCTGRCSQRADRRSLHARRTSGQVRTRESRGGPRNLHDTISSTATPVLNRVLDGPLERIPRLELLYCSGQQCKRDASQVMSWSRR